MTPYRNTLFLSRVPSMETIDKRDRGLEGTRPLALHIRDRRQWCGKDGLTQEKLASDCKAASHACAASVSSRVAPPISSFSVAIEGTRMPSTCFNMKKSFMAN